MKQSKLLCIIYLLLFCGSFFVGKKAYSSASDNGGLSFESVDPVWKSPLRIIGIEAEAAETLLQWFHSEAEIINDSVAEELRISTSQGSEPNIAKARVILRFMENGEFHQQDVNFEEIFLSGSRPLKDRPYPVINGLSFLESPEDREKSAGERATIQKNKIDKLLDINHPRAWAVHSEAHIILHIINQLSNILGPLSKEHPEQPIEITGLILQILTLKDCCDPCIGLLRNFARHFDRLLIKEIDQMHDCDLRVSSTMSKFVITVGKKEFLTSRKTIEEDKQSSPINLALPNVIIISRTPFIVK